MQAQVVSDYKSEEHRAARGILAPRGLLGDGEQQDGEMQPAHALSFPSLAWGSGEAWLAGALHVELFLSAERPFCLFI